MLRHKDVKFPHPGPLPADFFFGTISMTKSLTYFALLKMLLLNPVSTGLVYQLDFLQASTWMILLALILNLSLLPSKLLSREMIMMNTLPQTSPLTWMQLILLISMLKMNSMLRSHSFAQMLCLRNPLYLLAFVISRFTSRRCT